MLHTVTAKLAGMRKPQNFVVYPAKDDDECLTVQSDKAIGQFNRKTGVGVLNWRGSGGKYFMHLNPVLGAEPYTFPRDFVLKCQEMRPNFGDHIGMGVYIA